MPLSLRIPLEKDKMLKKVAAKTGKTKTAYVLEAVDEKLGLVKSREKTIRELAGWLTHEEAKQLREAIDIFNRVKQGDRD